MPVFIMTLECDSPAAIAAWVARAPGRVRTGPTPLPAAFAWLPAALAEAMVGGPVPQGPAARPRTAERRARVV